MQPDGHLAQQAAFRAGLWSDAVPDGVAGPDLALRFQVYRNNVAVGLRRALSARFPAVERLVGPEFFAAAARVFAAAHPPRTPVLAEWGAAFPAWLAAFPPVAHLPWLGDVAQLEWLRARALNAGDAAPADPAPLMAGDAGGLRLRLAPSVSPFASAHPAVAIWAQQRPDAALGPLPPGPSWALVARRPDHALVTIPLSGADHAVLVTLGQGARLGAVPADPTQVLTLLLTHGLIAAILPEGAP